jgi:hypothetical protein
VVKDIMATLSPLCLLTRSSLTYIIRPPGDAQQQSVTRPEETRSRHGVFLRAGSFLTSGRVRPEVRRKTDRSMRLRKPFRAGTLDHCETAFPGHARHVRDPQEGSTYD